MPKPRGHGSPNGEQIMEIFQRHPNWVPGRLNPQGVFFLLHKTNFVQEWYNNLLPAVIKSEDASVSYLICSFLFMSLITTLQANKWCPHQMYDSIMKLTPERLHQIGVCARMQRIFERSKDFKANSKKIRQLAAGSSHGPPRKPIQSVHPGAKLGHQSVKKTILAPEQIRAEIATHVPHGRITCERCKDLPEDQKCIRTYFVDQHFNPEELEGIVITFAPPDDCMLPKVVFSPFLFDIHSSFSFARNMVVIKNLHQRLCTSLQQNLTCVLLNFGNLYSVEQVVKETSQSWFIAQQEKW
jgi:hypothetical protein